MPFVQMLARKVEAEVEMWGLMALSIADWTSSSLLALASLPRRSCFGEYFLIRFSMASLSDYHSRNFLLVKRSLRSTIDRQLDNTTSS